MDRISIIQHFIDERKYTFYLEIGTHKGESFLPIRCRDKIAVDPYFMISKRVKWKWFFKNPSNWNNRYFEMSSDKFFEKLNCFRDSVKKPDIIFIDGLHTFEASLKDTLNSLRSLKKNGVIVIHDCNPPHKAAATPALSYEHAKKMDIPNWTGEWCGDVWKTILYLKRKYSKELNIFTINIDYGVGIIEFKAPNLPLDFRLDPNLFGTISEMNSEILFSNPEKVLNLRAANFTKWRKSKRHMFP